jgi:CheY-like chemotaxis protein
MSTVLPMRVLVVDDSEDTAITMAFLLKRYGHEAVVAHSGEAALQQAPLVRPDAMFIDLTMPGIDGFTVARQLRRTADFAETPLVAVSGHVDDDHRTQATAAGFTEFLPKPFPLTVLEAVMERIAARRSASHTMVATSQAAAEQSHQLSEASRQGLDAYWTSRTLPQVPVSIEKSGISNTLTLAERSAADGLRAWLKGQRCRVGPVFESRAGRFSFFSYTKRHCIGELIEKHGGFRVA